MYTNILSELLHELFFIKASVVELSQQAQIFEV